jgi:Carboxypeptidase regulatory-like domain/TonB dependent receptor-like, beta-barrel
MTRTYCHRACVVVTAFCLSLAMSAPLLAQRADRAIISGVVTDGQGAALPGATVIVRNDATGVETTLVTNNAGAYTTPPLVLGRYSVTVDLTGFKKAVTSGILLQGGESLRNDVTMQLGAIEETIQVQGRSPIDVTTPDVAHTVNEKYYRELPFITASDVRLAESVLQIQPGYLPMRPNGDPMFRGSQFNSRINGGQTMATENFFDGAAFGYAVGHQQSHESTPPVEAVQEVKVISTTYSAQYGHTSGGFIEYTGKSGTNTFRGSVYEYMADDALNSRGIFAERAGLDVTPLRNDNFGFTLGGPIIFPGYNGRNRTFFFTNIDYTRIRSGVLPGFGNTTPTDAFKAGDFSALLTGTQVGVDALGRPIFGGQIFNPATTRDVNGVPVRDPYPGNIIPAGDPLRSQVAARIVPFMVRPDREGISNNVLGNPAGDQTWELDARNIMFRVDHNFKQDFRGSFSFYWNRRPSVRNCGEVGGCTVPNDPETNSAQNTDYYGNGFFQRISTHHAHQQFDWIISDNLLNHSTIAYDRWFMGGNHLAAGANWPQRLFGANNGGILDTTAGPPVMSFTGNIPYNAIGLSGWPAFGFLVNNRWQFSNDITWVKGRHSLKAGFEFRHHDFPFRGWAVGAVAGDFNFNRLGTAGFDARGNNLAATGDPVASFLLGQVQQATQTIPVQPTFNETYTGIWINDEFKMSDKLTLTLGLRFDYQSARTETNDQYSTFDPNTPNPGAGNIPGAIIFAGEGPGLAGTRTFENPDKDAWGPRVGFAYKATDKDVIRGGYGIYYAHVAFDQFVGQPTTGFQANLLAPNTTNGISPAFYLDQGFPANRVEVPPFIDPAFGLGTAPIAVAPDGLTLPRFQNWSVTYQRQLTDNMMVDVSYIGNRGTRLNHHWQTLGVDANMNDPSVLGLGTAVLQSNINSPVARAANIPIPYPGFNGNVAQALRKYPQYQNIIWRGVPTGESQYHSAVFVLERRFSRGFQARFGYTYSRLENNGAESGQGDNGINGGVQNPADPLEWQLSADDTPHVFLTGFTWEVPGPQTGLANAILGGWNFSGVFRYESGRPLNIMMTNDLGGLLFNGQKRPNRVSGVDGVADISDFDPFTDNYFNRAAWTDPGPLQFGNAPKRDGTVRGFPNYSEDINIFKVFRLRDPMRLRFEYQIGNLFNRTVFCDPNQNWSATAFGTVNTQCNTPRSQQVAVRLDF